MTIHVADIAVYQRTLALADLIQAGFGGVNVKISHELGTKSVHPDAHRYVADAREAGIGVSTFHWLTGRYRGADQAAYAYARMMELPGGATGVAHVVDVEDTQVPPTEEVWRDYCATMSSLLGRPIATYSGDWWWQPRMGAAASPWSPWLWSAPRAGYLLDYPGDDATEHWRGYGAWPQLAVMQYRVAPVITPDGGIPVSQSAIRHTEVWDLMRGMEMVVTSIPASTSLLAEFNWLAPARDKRSDGTIGDAAHRQSSSDHNPDETGRTPSEDSDSIDEVHARDVDSSGPWPPGWSMERCVQIILGLARRNNGNGLPGLQNVIYNRRIWSRSWGWEQRPYTGSNPHDKHAHFGFRYGSGSGASNPENFTGPWGIRAAREQELREQEEMDPLAGYSREQLVDMMEEAVINLHVRGVHAALDDAVYQGYDAETQKQGRAVRDFILSPDIVRNVWGDAATNPFTTVLNALENAAGARKDLRDVTGPQLEQLRAAVQDLQTLVLQALGQQPGAGGGA